MSTQEAESVIQFRYVAQVHQGPAPVLFRLETWEIEAQRDGGERPLQSRVIAAGSRRT
jgi:hypothetical protein